MIPADHCTQADQHTLAPARYSDLLDWAEQMMRTHRQTRCLYCGNWAIWVPKTLADPEEDDHVLR